MNDIPLPNPYRSLDEEATFGPADLARRRLIQAHHIRTARLGNFTIVKEEEWIPADLLTRLNLARARAAARIEEQALREWVAATGGAPTGESATSDPSAAEPGDTSDHACGLRIPVDTVHGTDDERVVGAQVVDGERSAASLLLDLLREGLEPLLQVSGRFQVRAADCHESSPSVVGGGAVSPVPGDATVGEAGGVCRGSSARRACPGGCRSGAGASSPAPGQSTSVKTSVPGSVGCDVVNRHAGRLAGEVAALCEVVVDGDVRGRDALDREEEGGHRLPQGVELGADRQDVSFGQRSLGGPLGDDDSLLKLEPVLDVVKDVGEVPHDSSSVGAGDGEDGVLRSPSGSGASEPTEEAHPPSEQAQEPVLCVLPGVCFCGRCWREWRRSQ